jgi:hypothetical protein
MPDACALPLSAYCRSIGKFQGERVAPGQVGAEAVVQVSASGQ